MIGQVLDIVIIVLLGATVIYCYQLSRKLTVLREGHAELQALIVKFDSAAARAESNLKSMKNIDLANVRTVSAANDKAGALADELSVMISAGDRVAGRIETVMREVRSASTRTAERRQATR